MRIIAGTHGGRRFRAPRHAGVRPTEDRVREAWFNILQGHVPGAQVLDLFAGSGALGLEALSRGAARVHFVESHRVSLGVLQGNLASLGFTDRAVVHRTNALSFAQHLSPGAFDIALADPPYRHDYASQLVAVFRRTPFAAVLGVEHQARQSVPGDDTRRWGDSAVTFCYAP